MKRGGRFPDDQAEITFTDAAIEQLEEFPDHLVDNILVSIVALCDNPSGKHALKKPLSGLNTVELDGRRMSCVYRATPASAADRQTGLIEIVCFGQRSDDEVYSIASDLVRSGILSQDEATQIWEALALLDALAEDVGLDGWDYAPAPAPAWLIAAATNAGLPPDQLRHMSQREIEAAMANVYEAADPATAIAEAAQRSNPLATTTSAPDMAERAKPRCDKYMRRARRNCIRKANHPGPCRST